MQCRLSTYAKDKWDLYWYDKNLQGDIVGVYNSSGTKLVTYKYDAWGSPYITYHSGNASSLYAKNPFRYRGYYYDKDLGFYYLQTRYYDPLNCRFISPDAASVITATPAGLTDKNLYAYCDNNPVSRADDGGEFWNVLIGAATGAFSQLATDLISSAVSGEWRMSSFIDYAGAAIGGAIGAVLPGSGVLKDTISAATSTVVGMTVNNIANSITGEGEMHTADEIFYDSVNSALVAGLSSGMVRGSKYADAIGKIKIKNEPVVLNFVSGVGSMVIDGILNSKAFEAWPKTHAWER